MDAATWTNLWTALGPWGVVVGIALTLVTQWLRAWLPRSRLPMVPPLPDGSRPAPPALHDQFPLVVLLLQALRRLPQGRTATLDDLPHELVVQLRQEVHKLRMAQAARHTAALADLNRPD
jgi:hypothetical protein